ncbi:MAG: dTMP kinase [Burkholderiaceae bacterium]
MNARFITFEGIDGAGKSTHIGWYVEQLRARGLTVLATREPGGSALAESLRELLLHQPMSLETELLLVFAARRDHLERVVRPALAAGQWVVCDRFTDSTYAYQGGGRGAPLSRIAELERWVHGDLQPRRTYLFDLEPDEAARRRGAARAADRFEAEDAAFFERVRRGYLDRTAQAAQRFLLLDGAEPIEELRKILEKDLINICSE